MENKDHRRKGIIKKEKEAQNKGIVVLPYVNWLSEKVVCILKKRGIVSAMKPYTSMKSHLVHPKDKRDPKEGVYTIDHTGCEKKYVGETEKKLKVRVKEHNWIRKSEPRNCAYKGKKQTITKWDVALESTTDHTVKENHVIDW